MLYCTECGTPTGGEVQKFCTTCGADLAAAGPETGTALTTSIPSGSAETQVWTGGARPDPEASGSDPVTGAGPPTTAMPFSGPPSPEADPPTALMPSAGPPTTAIPVTGPPPPEAAPWSPGATSTPADETAQQPEPGLWSRGATSTPADETVQQPGLSPWSRDTTSAPADETALQEGSSPWSPGATSTPAGETPQQPEPGPWSRGATSTPADETVQQPGPSPWSRDATQSPGYPTGPQYPPAAPYTPASQYGPGSQPYPSDPAAPYTPASQYGPGSPSYPSAPARPGARPPEPPRNRSAMWIVVVVVAVLLVGGGGGFAAWKFVLHKSPAPAPNVTQNQAGGSPAQGSPTPGVPSPTPSAESTPTPVATSTPGAFPVAVSSSAAQQPGQQQVVSFLQSYFAAINAHSYRRYRALLTPSEQPTRSQFKTGFGTTSDSAATLAAITPSGSGVAATVKFTSHQSPSASPTGTGCNTWRITLFLEQNGSGYLIGPAAPGYHAQDRAC
jgi:hypothetical protein